MKNRTTFRRFLRELAAMLGVIALAVAVGLVWYLIVIKSLDIPPLWSAFSQLGQ